MGTMGTRYWLTLLMIVASNTVACEDKARPEFGKCVAADAKGDVLAAATACEAAVTADATSTSGKEAALKLASMQPAVTKARAEKAEKDAKAAAEKAKADEADRQATAQANAARAAQLKAKAKFRDTGEDDLCVSAGKPKNGLAITGGSYDDNEAVATAMGCVRSHVYYPQQGHSAVDNYYCCP